MPRRSNARARPRKPPTSGADGVKRCGWCGEDPLYVAYHDEEWGVPVHDDRTLFEFLLLEGAQAGLAWITILRKRQGYREAFADFDPAKVARFTPARQQKLLGNPEIVRNRLKIAGAVKNAKAFLALQDERGSFADYLWGHVGGKPIVNRFRGLEEVPAKTELSDSISRDLKKRGFSFVGSTILYAYLQAVGVVNDHLVGCAHRDGPRRGRRQSRRR
jgi:DNA-3-methyladenine glycosylase I